MPPFVLLLLLILFGSFGFGLYVMIRGISGVKRHDPDGSYCGHCGYDVRGVSSMQCPECGSDLKQVGILKHVKTRSTGWILAGVFMMLLPLLFASLFVMRGSSGSSSVTSVPIQSSPMQVVPADSGQPTDEPE